MQVTQSDPFPSSPSYGVEGLTHQTNDSLVLHFIADSAIADTDWFTEHDLWHVINSSMIVKPLHHRLSNLYITQDPSCHSQVHV